MYKNNQRVRKITTIRYVVCTCFLGEQNNAGVVIVTRFILRDLNNTDTLDLQKQTRTISKSYMLVTLRTLRATCIIYVLFMETECYK